MDIEKLADDLNTQLLAVEELFAARFKLPAFVPMSQGCVLWWRKRDRSWVFVVETLASGERDLVGSSSLRERIEAAGLLRSLRDALIETERRVNAELELAVARAAAFVAELKQAKK